MNEPAFPAFTPDNPYLSKGMTLRDYFAAKAMTGMLCGEFNVFKDVAHLAKRSYVIADAMLAERDKKKDG